MSDEQWNAEGWRKGALQSSDEQTHYGFVDGEEGVELYTSRKSIEELSMLNAYNCYLGDHVSLARVLCEFLVHVDTRDRSVAPHLLMQGYWEPWVTKCIHDFVKPGMTVVDVGAHYGYYSLLMSRVAKRVLAFEPNPNTRILLRRTLELNGANNVLVRPTALGAELGEAVFHASQSYSGSSTLMPAVEGERHPISEPGYMVGRCQTETLDAELALLNAERVDFVKCDAERAESLVWRGMAKTWERNPQMRACLESVGTRAEREALYDLVNETAEILVVNGDGSPEYWPREQIVSSRGADMLWVVHR